MQHCHVHNRCHNRGHAALRHVLRLPCAYTAGVQQPPPTASAEHQPPAVVFVAAVAAAARHLPNYCNHTCHSASCAAAAEGPCGPCGRRLFATQEPILLLAPLLPWHSWLLLALHLQQLLGASPTALAASLPLAASPSPTGPRQRSSCQCTGCCQQSRAAHAHGSDAAALSPGQLLSTLQLPTTQP